MSGEDSASGGRARRWLRNAGRILAAVAGVLLLVSMFASELARMVSPKLAISPLELPEGVDIRYSDMLVDLIGRGTPSGRATAVTLGSAIVVHSRYDGLTAAARCGIIRHELEHVAQYERYWRFYLPLYGALYVLHGYRGHPFERGAPGSGTTESPARDGPPGICAAAGSEPR